MFHEYLSHYSPWLDILLHWNLNIPLQLQLKGNEKNYSVESMGQRISERVFLTYMILMWTILYFIYKKCLNVHLRNLGYALVRRNRISNATWSCIIVSAIVLYTVFFWNTFLKPEISLIFLKSFFIHYTGIVLFLNDKWLKGFSNCFFLLFIFGITRKSLQPPVTGIFLLKSFDFLMLDVCRLLYLRWPKKIKPFYAKSLYAIYCIFWTYLYMVHVPTNLLLPYKYQSLNEKLFLWLWFITQYLDFVWLDLIRHFNTSNSLDLCLFPSPSVESIHLKKILDAHKELRNSSKTKGTVTMKKELWQTLLCAMTMKKKINRLRKSKQEKSRKASEYESTVIESKKNE